MSDIDKFLKQIEKLIAPVRRVSETLDKIVPPAILEMNKALAPTVQRMNEVTAAFQPLATKLNRTLAKVAEHARIWQEKRKQDVTVMAENGWYPNWFTFFYQPEEEHGSLDELMTSHLTENWDEITLKVIELCPNRKHILENAFELHRSGNYVAAIPLFLAQSDGICCEKLKSFLFAGNDTESKILELIERDEMPTNMLTDVFLEPFKLKNHHNSGISKYSETAKEKAPNRNGIIHGHRRHLDYGTELNSLKCFSLLSFIVYSTKELMGEI
jgi:hypothetical protein